MNIQYSESNTVLLTSSTASKNAKIKGVKIIYSTAKTYGQPTLSVLQYPTVAV